MASHLPGHCFLSTDGLRETNIGRIACIRNCISMHFFAKLHALIFIIIHYHINEITDKRGTEMGDGRYAWSLQLSFLMSNVDSNLLLVHSFIDSEYFCPYFYRFDLAINIFLGILYFY